MQQIDAFIRCALGKIDELAEKLVDMFQRPVHEWEIGDAKRAAQTDEKLIGPIKRDIVPAFACILSEQA